MVFLSNLKRVLLVRKCQYTVLLERTPKLHKPQNETSFHPGGTGSGVWGMFQRYVGKTSDSFSLQLRSTKSLAFKGLKNCQDVSIPHGCFPRTNNVYKKVYPKVGRYRYTKKISAQIMYGLESPRL